MKPEKVKAMLEDLSSTFKLNLDDNQISFGTGIVLKHLNKKEVR